MIIKHKTEEYQSPLKTVGGNEGDKCKYPTRLDTYGKGCYFNCKYCYARSLLDFRGYWNPNKPEPANIQKIKRIIQKTPTGSVLRLGGMTDCFQPREAIDKITYATIHMLNKKRIHYLIVTKSDILTRKRYLKVLDPELAHIQISIPSTNNKILNMTDNAPPYEKRKQTVETLYNKKYDVSIRLSPFLYPHIDYNELNSIQCDKILIEFLRINSKMTELQKIINPNHYTVKHNNYRHLTLKNKLKLIQKIKFKQITVCEDVTTHYKYFKQNINHNPHDCCNLRIPR